MERLEDQRTPYTYESPSQELLDAQKREYGAARQLPTISIVVPCYKTPAAYFLAMVDSVMQQSYGNWELILAVADTDGMGRYHQMLAELAADDERIRLLALKENEGIAGNTNEGIAAATGDYIALLDHDDFLTPDAICEVTRAIQKPGEQEPILVYSDEDKCDESGTSFFEPNRKPDFNYDWLLSNNYICHLTVIRGEYMRNLQLCPSYDGGQDYDLLLRCVAEIRHRCMVDNLLGTGTPHKIGDFVRHIPRVLYHWRCNPASTAGNTEVKAYAYNAGRRAVQSHLDSQGIRAFVSDLPHVGFYRVQYDPDVFASREDVGAIGGKLVNRRGLLVGGIYEEDGTVPYKGLPRHYSGGFQHRAVIQQDAAAVDLRCMKVRPELQGLYFETLGIAYREDKVPGPMTEEEYVKKSLEFCRRVRETGYRILWDPQMEQAL